MVWRDDPFGISQHDPVNISRVSFFGPICKGIKVLLHLALWLLAGQAGPLAFVNLGFQTVYFILHICHLLQCLVFLT